MSIEKLEIDCAAFTQFQLSSFLTKWLWLDNTTLVFPWTCPSNSQFIKLAYLTLFPNKTFSISFRCIKHLQIFVTAQVNFLTNFFAIPFYKKYFFFLSRCPTRTHFHSRLFVVCRETLKIVRYLDLPGNVVDVQVDSKAREFFLTLLINKTHEYENIVDGAYTPLGAKQFDQLNCYLGTPWTGKEDFRGQREHVIYKFNADTTNWYTNSCHVFIAYISAAVDSATGLESLKIRSYVNRTAYSGERMHLTNDFVVAHEDKPIGSKIMSRFHHYHFDITIDNCFLKSCKVYYHPTLPVSLVILSDSRSFAMYLEEWATSTHRKDFPDISNNLYQYKKEPVKYECADEADIQLSD